LKWLSVKRGADLRAVRHRPPPDPPGRHVLYVI